MDVAIVVLCFAIIAVFMVTVLTMVAGFLYWSRKKQEPKPEIRRPASVSVHGIWVDHIISMLVSRGYVKEVNKNVIHERKRLLAEMDSIVEKVRREDDEPIAVLVKPERR